MTYDPWEWMCDGCNTVYPGPPQPGIWCVQCPRCGGDTAPRGVIERRRLEREIERLRRERETLAAAVRAREEARRAAISPYRSSSEPVSETLRLERLHSEACKRDEAAHQKALALLDGGKAGDAK